MALNFYETYVLQSILERVKTTPSFFRDRFAPTAAEDIFAADKVLIETQEKGRKLAAFVAPRAGDIPVDRDGYSVSAYAPPYIAPSRLLTLDDLAKRGYGEALYPNATPDERAARIIAKDLEDLSDFIDRRIEWMIAQTMINNAVTVQEYVDANNQGQSTTIQFYESGHSTDHVYNIGNTWDGGSGDFFGDVRAMATMLSRRGLPAADLLLGSDAADAILYLDDVRDLLNKTSGIITGEINQRIAYPGVAMMGTMNFGGFNLNVWAVNESYQADNGTETAYLPAKSAIVTFPGCCHTMFGQVTQMDYGSDIQTGHAAAKVPKVSVDQNNDTRKLRLASRPLVAPRAYCPFIYAANAVS